VETVIDNQKILQALRGAMSSLTPREEKIVRLRFGIAEPDDDTERFPITESEYSDLKDAARSAKKVGVK
jgi:DNA-directed RNA polymerase sigma subunit (sigma70/sigma32)